MAPQHSKIAVDISQSVNSVNNRTHSLRKILRMAITDLVINTRLNGRLTLDPAGMHCPSWDNVVTERIAAKRQTAGIVFTHRPKIRFFAQQGRLVAPLQVKLCRTDGHLGPLTCAKFYLNRHRGVGMRPPKYQNFPLFDKEWATPLTDFKIF